MLCNIILSSLTTHNYNYNTFDRSKSVNLDGSVNNPAMHGNYTNVPIEMGSEWLYPETELSGKHFHMIVKTSLSLSLIQTCDTQLNLSL